MIVFQVATVLISHSWKLRECKGKNNTEIWVSGGFFLYKWGGFSLCDILMTYKPCKNIRGSVSLLLWDYFS